MTIFSRTKEMRDGRTTHLLWELDNLIESVVRCQEIASNLSVSNFDYWYHGKMGMKLATEKRFHINKNYFLLPFQCMTFTTNVLIWMSFGNNFFDISWVANTDLSKHCVCLQCNDKTFRSVKPSIVRSEKVGGLNSLFEGYPLWCWNLHGFMPPLAWINTSG